MSNSDDFQDKLTSFLKIFKNRPYHLAKYLIDNSALNKPFINKLIKSDKLNKLEDKSNIYISDISQMEEYYSSFLDNIKSSGKSIEEITKDLNEKMEELIKLEKFEEAAKLRDYMIKKSIKRSK
jgi:septation ring formation regulator EzrA